MSEARAEILHRIRTALADRPAPAPIPRDYRQAGADADASLLDLFAERVEDYNAGVHRVHQGSDVASVITAVLAERGIEPIVVPDGFPNAWLPQLTTIREPVDVPGLDAAGAVISTCRVAVAETGTIVLDAGPGMGPRALTLVPDYHLVIVHAAQITPGVPDAVAALDPTRPLTWISGPSATSDIELNRVEGVHGPRTLDVVLIQE